ncbi:MAG: hypothetical protein QGI20_11720 [Verrucomicrobiota bacterium]|nr:hypothetical protein [Verrucomicrobiota bacterium]MDP6252600.1 hypothetical protein [Verrucomicrobiota bacterium]
MIASGCGYVACENGTQASELHQSLVVIAIIAILIALLFPALIEDLLEEIGKLEQPYKLILGSTEPKTGMLIGGIQSLLQASVCLGQVHNERG